MGDQVKIKSLGKALSILELFIEESSLGVNEIAARMNLNKSNVSDILSTFAAAGYVEKDEETGKYRLGLKLLRYAYPIVQRMEIHKLLYPHMLLLAEHLGEMVYLAIPYGKEALYLQNALPVTGQGSYLVRSVLGEKAPLYCTGIGKAMLSRMPEEEWKDRLPEVYTRFTENTITCDEEMFRVLRSDRERGYSVDNVEHEYGMCCVGIPILDGKGNVIAGLSVSGPADRMTPERCGEIAMQLKKHNEMIAAYMN